MDEFNEQWVKPFYLEVLHGNYTNLQGRELDDFVSSARQALSNIDEAVVERLLLSQGWRERLTGSWFAGLKRWNKFKETIGSLLIESDRVYAGQGYSFALGRFANAALSISYLTCAYQKLHPACNHFSLRTADRILWVILSRVWAQWRSVLVIIKPETVIAWQRKGFRLYWRWKSRAGKSGRPCVSRELRELIRRRLYYSTDVMVFNKRREILRRSMKVQLKSGQRLRISLASRK